ncbi:MAG: MFS transporter [Phycisphaerales bacterium]
MPPPAETAPPHDIAPTRRASVHREWRFVGFGFLLALYSSFGQTFFVSLFADPIRAEFGLSHGRWGLIYSLGTLASGLTMMRAGALVDTMSLPRLTLWLTGGLTLACGLFAVAPAAIVLIPAVYLVRLFGQGMLSHTAQTTMARYYDRGRGRAMSLSSLGHAAGEAILPTLGVALILAVGWREAWVRVALVVLVTLPALSWLLLRGFGARHADHVERAAARERADDALTAAAAATVTATTTDRASDADSAAPAAPRGDRTRGQAIADPGFWMLILCVMAPGFIVTGIFFHQNHLVAVQGWTKPAFAATFGVFAFTQLPAALIAGPLVDRYGAVRLVPFYLLPMAAGLGVLAATPDFAAAWVFMGLTGLTAGAAGPVVGAMWAERYGVRHLGAIRGFVTAILVIATALSPASMGVLIDAGVPLAAMIAAAAVYATFAGGLALVALRRPAP